MAAYLQQEMGSNYMIKVMIKVFVVFLINRQPVLSAEMLRNVALGKPVTLSTTLGSYTQSNASSAVDGRISRDINNCWCCVSTVSEENPWLMVDLGEEYLVQIVVIIGRSDNRKDEISRNLKNLQMFNGNYTSTGQLVPQMQIKMVNNTASTRNLDQFLRHITLKRPKPAYVASHEWFLQVCEIEIYVKACHSGQYGNGVCNNTCGHCKDGRPCDGVTGQCREGCDPGYVGNTCTQECDPGQYGNNCSEMCGHCRRRQSCNHLTGYCPGSCGSGYRGDKCHEECFSGTYGPNCSQSCGQCFGTETCHHINGTCTFGCRVDFLGDLCQETADKQSSHIATAAVSVSVCAVAVAVIVAVRLMRRKRMLMSSRNESTYEVPVWHAHEDESAYSVLDNTHNLCSSDSTNKWHNEHIN